jgi:AAA+ superfamily predicted ATPase
MSELSHRNSAIWICTVRTEEECLRRGLFGDSDAAEWKFQKLRRGDVCFLLNMETDMLIGVFEAQVGVSREIEREAWDGKFPLQVRVRCISKSPQRVANASTRLPAAGIPMDDRKGGKLPRFYTYSPDVTRKILALFPGGSVPGKVAGTDAAGDSSRTPDSLPRSEKAVHTTSNGEPRGFARVAGLEDVKKYVNQRVVAPMRAPGLAAAYRMRRGAGLLLYGPPGTGKTLLARAIAEEISCEMSEISPSIVQGYPGDAEQRLAEIFRKAQSEPRAVILFDEADALLAESIQNSSVMQRVVPALKTLLSDALQNEAQGLVVVAASNKPWNIDKAFLRPGRLGFQRLVDLPSENERIELLRLFLSGLPTDPSVLNDDALKIIAEKCPDYSGADLRGLVETVVDDVFKAALEAHPELWDSDEMPAREQLRPITTDLLLAACSRVRSSVSPDDLPRYRSFRA